MLQSIIAQTIRSMQAKQERLAMFLTISFFSLSLLTWLILDHRLPANDEAGHILNSYTYVDLLRHAKFWRSDWLYKFLTVNQFYPPAIHIFNGILRLLFGLGRQADIISLTIFNLILSASTFGICRLLTGSSLAGILGIICINCYPNLNYLNHQYLLDYPLVAMISLGLLALIWWKHRPSVKRAFVCGVAIGSMCMSKQIAACYLVLPALYYFVQAVKLDLQQQKIRETKQIVIIGIIAFTISFPWLYLNASSAHQATDQLACEISLATSAPTFFGNLMFYLIALPHMMSAVLFGLFLLSLQMVPDRKRLLPIGLSALGGILLVSSLTWIFPKEQYLAPVLVTCAVYSAAALNIMFKSKSRWLKLIGGSLTAFAFLQFFFTNFTPYPVPSIGPAWQCFNWPGKPYANHPQPSEDWGQEWTIKQIDAIDKKRVTWLNILSNTPETNVHTFEFLVARLGSAVKPTTSRYYTIVGDRLDFSQQQAFNYQWYLFRSSDSGYPLKDPVSKLNYDRLYNFVCNSGHFYLVGKHLLPDGSMLSLYRQK